MVQGTVYLLFYDIRYPISWFFTRVAMVMAMASV